jgi:L-gulonate 3-dehydrogenase
MIRTTACIGTGIIGASWAVAFSRSVEKVWIWDASASNLAAGKHAIAQTLRFLQESGSIVSADEALSRIHAATSLQEAVTQSDYIQESVSEELPLKRKVFAQLDRLAPRHSLLASSTSEIQPSTFLEELPGRDRCLVVHPLNPPHLVPAVEICPSTFTAQARIAEVLAFMRRLGQVPILINKEVKGFVMNRLQVAVIREALHLVKAGYCSAADVDSAVTQGLGLRWATMGPFETNFLSTRGGYGGFLKAYGPTLASIAEDLAKDFQFDERLGRDIDEQLRQRFGTLDHQDRELSRDRQLIKLRQLLTG